MDVAEMLVKIAENAQADKDTIEQKNSKIKELNLKITGLELADSRAHDKAEQLLTEQDLYIGDVYETGAYDTAALIGIAQERNPLVYESGVNNGIEQGEQLAYDKFWDTLQVNGTLTDYKGVFAGASWTPELFNPKYPIKPKYAQCMFMNFCRHDNSKYFELIDLSKWNIDFSECKTFNSAFQNARIKNTGFIDFSAAPSSLDRVFDCSDWGSIEKISLKVVEKNTYTIPFYYCSDTKEIIFSDDSVIANNGLSFQWSSKLNKDSIISIFNALSPTKTGLSITLSKSAVNAAFGINVDDETTFPEGSEYYTLRHSKDNWTVNYI